MNKGRKIVTVAGTLGLGLTAALIAAGPASADTIGAPGQDICGMQLCLYYYTGAQGGMWYSDGSQWNDLAGQRFGQGPTTSGGEGVGQLVKNDAESANNGGYYDVYIYVNSAAYGWGAYDYLPAGWGGDLATTYNNEASYSTSNYG